MNVMYLITDHTEEKQSGKAVERHDHFGQLSIIIIQSRYDTCGT